MAMRAQVERRTRHHEEAADEVAVKRAEHAPPTEDLKHELDDLLDEIDEVLEENAEEFIKGYVQKGGE